ncbi:hypothetical protein [Algivirga pacifica]|uniref:Uncharacterized protein n=1 Tax=Algivirga pacifica TaxID=1162670 RepID=A0ABP9DJ31_9BACT
MKKSTRKPLSFLLLLLLFISCQDNPPQGNLSEIEKASALANQYMMKSLHDNGMFTYRVKTNPKSYVKKRYNILRHAGAIYAMCQYYEHAPSPQGLESILSAGNFLKSTSLKSVNNDPSLKAIWSDPSISNTGKVIQAKLGGTGIGLLALLHIEKIKPGFTSKKDLIAMGNFLLYMQKKDGSFYTKYIPSKGGKNDEWVSLFYPGEAALGLLMLYEYDPNPKWFEAAYHSLMYLAKLREGRKTVETDCWALIATSKLYKSQNYSQFKVSEERLNQHAKQICESILALKINSHRSPYHIGGFQENGYVTPTSCRLEGLTAALSFLPQQDPLYSKVVESLQTGYIFLLRAQYKKGTFTGGFPRKVSYNNGLKLKTNMIQIDCVQHSLSALVGFMNLQVDDYFQSYVKNYDNNSEALSLNK